MTKHELSASGHDSQDIQHHNSSDNDLTIQPFELSQILC